MNDQLYAHYKKIYDYNTMNLLTYPYPPVKTF